MMNISMLFMPAVLLLSGLSLSFAKEASKNNSRPIPSKIQYAGQQSYQPDNNSIYGSSDSFNPYGSFPGIYGGFAGPQEILRNGFRGSGDSSQDENQDGGYQNEQNTGGSGFQYPSSDGSGFQYPSSGGSGFQYPSSGGSGSQYPSSGEGNEVPNGVFSNPFLGQRRITSGIPGYGGTTDSGSEQGYGGGSYPGGRYTPSYGQQPGIYSSPSGFRPGFGQGFIYPTDQGYGYPLGGVGSGTGFRQPNYPYGYGTGNGYGVNPGILRRIPAGVLPSAGGNGIYGQIPRGYGPALFGYGQYPEMSYPGLGFEYGRLNESNPGGGGSYRNITPQGAYTQSTPPSVSPGEASQAKIKSLRKEDP